MYISCTFHEVKSPTTESYNIIRYERLPDYIVVLLVGSQKLKCRINLLQLQPKLPNV